MTATSPRQAILDRIRAATRDDESRYDALPRNYIRRGSIGGEERIRLMTERLREYDAEVVEAAPSGLQSVIIHLIQRSGRHQIVTPAGLRADWLGAGVDWKVDNDLSNDEIEQCGGVLTGASAAIADSGTIVLHHGPREGRRVITLLPDFHLCILQATQIVETLPEYFARFPEPPRLATYISGPSATADIEMTRIKGVHGPRLMSVVIVRDDP
jgi:L-lactate dehydrogenase complex protein LldG